MVMQLPLDIQLRQDATFDNFVVGDNQEVVTALRNSSHGVGEKYLYCHGKAGVGLSHLLQAYCHEAGNFQKRATYLPLQELYDYGAGILEGLETLDCICLDDISQVSGHDGWEEALFHCFNRVREAGAALVIADHKPLAALDIKLPDLKSRLGWGVNYPVAELPDSEKESLLQQWADERSFRISNEVAHFVISHYPRDINFLKQLISLLDQETLARQQKVTIPLVKDLLKSKFR